MTDFTQLDDTIYRRVLREHRVASPLHALDLHLGLWEWMGTVDHVRWSTMFSRAYGSGFSIDGSRDPNQVARTEERIVNLGRTHYVDPLICQGIEATRDIMPPAVLHPADVPSPAGFAVFGRPIAYPAFSGSEYGDYLLSIRAIAWEVTDGIMVRPGELGPGVTLWVWADTDTVAAADGPLDDMWLGHQPRVVLTDFTAWAFGLPWGDADEPFDVTPESLMQVQRVVNPHIGMLRRHILALWAYMRDRIVKVEAWTPPRPARRRATRAGMPEAGSVVLVHLRAVDYPDRDVAPGEPPTWTHRWWVTSYWATRHTKEGPRLVRVTGHLKGPDHLPVIDKAKVVSVDR